MQKLDLHKFISPGDLVFDVGSCEGAKAAEYLNHGASRVIAFEPNPTMQEFLHKRFDEDPRVTIDPRGLWEKTGIIRFHVSTTNPATSTFIDSVPEYYEAYNRAYRDMPDYIQWDNDILVPVFTLDDAFDLYGIPSFIKIDVESSEEYVLRGMNTIVPAISFEFYPKPLSTFKDSVEVAKSIGYKKFNYIISQSSDWNVSESFDYAFDDWVDYETLLEKLLREPINPHSVYGDIYAKA